MNEGVGLFELALDWLRDHYDDFLFRREDDVVTVLWAKMVKTAREKSLPIVVDYEQNFKVASGRLQCDIVIRGDDANPLLCVEVKYEPARTRRDIVHRALKHGRPEHLLPGHGLKGHRCDIEKLPLYVEEAGAKMAFAVLIDENRYHYSRMTACRLPEGTSWIEWEAKTPDGFDTAIMVSRFPFLEYRA